MDDLISRWVAIDVAKEELDNGTFYDIPSKIESLPSAQPEVLDTNVGKWIPCDKGKPDPYRRVLMTERRPDWNGKEYYIVTLDSFCNHRGDVVAWMLLPEPFKEDDE